MAIKTDDIRMSLTFDGETSASYGVMILGEGVFNAPEREVEMISIPGRNGSFALDKGRFENIEVTYPAMLVTNSTADFAQGISDFRNMLCSKKGYCRLTDDYNPDEYRLAVYKSGLEVDEKVLRAGEFDITFDCKPQRYLMSGESPIEVDDGDVILNPTLFEAHPLLMVEGYGDIVMNGYEVSVANALMGEVAVGEATKNTSGNPITQALDANLYNDGDTLTVLPFNPKATYKKKSGVTNVVLGTRTNCTASTSGDYITVTMYPNAHSFGTSTNASFYLQGSVVVTYEKSGSQYSTALECNIYVQYDATNHTLTYTDVSAAPEEWTLRMKTTASGEVVADSSVSVLGNPTCIDCDLGEAYKYENDSLVPLNRYIDIGSKLPELSPGNNEITFDNTFTDVIVVPRWWRV